MEVNSAQKSTFHEEITKSLNVYIAGNPNCGKTSLFNALTGLRYKVANYPGVTVEKKTGRMRGSEGRAVTLTDLPGVYSIGSLSEDEEVASNALLGLRYEETPDVLVAVLDSSNLERNLYLLTQLLDLSVPIVGVLTMVDLAESKGVRVHSELLSRELDIPIVSVNPNKGTGLKELRELIEKVATNKVVSKKSFLWAKGAKGSEVLLDQADKLATLVEDSVLTSKSDSKLKVQKQSYTQYGLSLLSGSLSAPTSQISSNIEEIKELLSREHSVDVSSAEASLRYKWINQVVKKSVQRINTDSQLSDKVDSLLTHKYIGPVIFTLIMSSIFQAIFLWAEAPMNVIDGMVSSLGEYLRETIPESMFQSLLVDGVLAGVGNVVIFIPQIAILFFLLGLLEDTGYLSRAAFVMDRLMRPFGVQGRSFIPLLSSFACAIPGIMSTRTIASRSDRLTTILIAPLMSCSARLPVYTVLIAACVPDYTVGGFFSLQGLILLSMYLLGIIAAAIVSLILKSSILKGAPSLFLMEMPTVRLPSLKTVFWDAYDRVLTFLKNAGTIILACSIVLWFLATFPAPPDSIPEGRSPVEYSFAGKMGKAIEPAIKPLGFTWEIGVGILASFAAREVFISALATIYNLEDNESSSSLITLLKDKKDKGEFTTSSAISLMVFYVFACQCMSTLAVCRRETGSWSWVVLMFVYMTILAYGMSYLTYNSLHYMGVV